ncbi:WbqC family protein [uncultured Bacteroides sp.]|uniref:WbqC family protein n=1 Tax=uncultured Bacteroides sp. TaxID=162156 RepID=UPI002AABB47F|nr:WbqC family protein [uncultured Bacteroides sp.]
MKLGAMQPYFLPYIGYFQLIKAVDKYVICDDVNYIKNGWINRNNILVNHEKKLFTIKLKKSSQNKLINEIEIEDDFRSWLKTIQVNYAKAPYFRDVVSLLENMVSYENRSLSDFIINSLKEILSYLHIDTPLLISSQLKKNCSFKGKDKVINMCDILGADVYINAIGGQKLYDKEEFASHGIDLRFINSEIVPYKQLKNEFIPCMSILDVMMFNSVEEVNSMLDKYKLI